ncbi:uncharacterized protein [Arachis hypogaea]|uniref:uncharacterized protein isoform X1 n=2 Tax=Arachis hypogaea TaxID=3818 RepID=UPI0034E7387C
MENSFLRPLGHLELDLPEAPTIKAPRLPPLAVDPYTRYGPKAEITHLFRTPESKVAVEGRVQFDLLQVSFTGSMEVGREIMHAAASSNLKQVSLELVGKSPLLIFDDADVDKAASLALLGIVYNKGEICVESSVCLFRKGMCSIIILKDGFRQGFLLEELFWNCLLECWMTTRVISLALQFVEEETGIKFKLEDMVDLTAFLDSSTGCRFFPSPTVDYKRPTYEEVENLQALLPRECNIYQMQIGEMVNFMDSKCSSIHFLH